MPVGAQWVSSGCWPPAMRGEPGLGDHLGGGPSTFSAYIVAPQRPFQAQEQGPTARNCRGLRASQLQGLQWGVLNGREASTTVPENPDRVAALAAPCSTKLHFREPGALEGGHRRAFVVASEGL